MESWNVWKDDNLGTVNLLRSSVDSTAARYADITGSNPSSFKFLFCFVAFFFTCYIGEMMECPFSTPVCCI